MSTTLARWPLRSLSKAERRRAQQSDDTADLAEPAAVPSHVDVQVAADAADGVIAEGDALNAVAQVDSGGEEQIDEPISACASPPPSTDFAALLSLAARASHLRCGFASDHAPSRAR